ncbi:helix-turn-helix domain-containing protein [Dictyobacter formicarum]|uniref:HTH luxR-type domain-containing protein n=1 Tax=Dictyobacter formicarum TaxID=2778368 RepID=A0ABQ3VP75_9CHLR|nr:helix-turn-helix transcriptional regulator [Dictyobacter formicarum]GHO87383.1 hypothetical protein KSZ_53890 [Dictyobacter formicarum]
MQTFLFSTAFLDRLCAPLCASILCGYLPQEEQSQQDSSLASEVASRYAQEMLEDLEHRNLFLIPLDHQRRWYRYHHLFAQALQARLALLHPTRIAEIHTRASLWYEQQGETREAIAHALAASSASTDSPEAVQSRPQPLLDPLSGREREALQLLATGATNAAIAEQLVIAPSTVKRHMNDIFSKLGVTNRTQAVARARDLHIL